MSQKNSKNGNGSNPLVDEFLREKGGALKDFIFKIIGDPNDTDDIFQRALEKILKYQHQFRGGSKFSTWAYRIAKNEAFRYIGERNYRRRHIKTNQEVYEIVLGEYSSERGSEAHYKNPEEMFKETEQREINREICNDERNRVLIFQSQDYTVSEIAEMLSIPKGSVKSEAFYARKRLRNELGERGLSFL